MFHINYDIELTEELLRQMFGKFTTEVQPRLEKYKNYYDGLQAISAKTYTDETKKCNRSVTNFIKNITDNYSGYIASPGFISYSSSNDISDIMEILRYNDYQSEDSDFLLNALIYGVGAELMYTDRESHVRFKLINPINCFAIYDDSLTNDMLYFVRWYLKNEWANDSLYCVDVYSNATIKHYESNSLTHFKLISEEPHYFNQCPANVFYLPDEKSIFDCVMSLQDSYNEELTNELDEYSAFCDSYMVITNGEINTEEAQEMKRKRLLMLPLDAKAEWLTKQSNDGQVENILKRLHESIYRVAQCPDFSNESFNSGVTSGIALRFRLCNMENRAAKVAAEMKKALQRRIELICGFSSLLMGEEVFRDIKIDFKRNIPDDLADKINLVNSLKGVVSDKTLLGQIPFVEDVQAEIEAVQEQKKANMEIYSFGDSHTHEEAEEE